MEELSPFKLQYSYIKPDEVVRVYLKIEEELGICSLGRLQDYYKRKGLVNPVTRQPPTRQALLHALSRTPEGRAIISRASHARFLNRPATGWPEERWERDRKRAEITVPKV